MFNGIGNTEIIIIAVVLLVLFGGRKLPELGRGLGESIKELKKAMSPEDDKKKAKDEE